MSYTCTLLTAGQKVEISQFVVNWKASKQKKPILTIITENPCQEGKQITVVGSRLARIRRNDEEIKHSKPVKKEKNDSIGEAQTTDCCAKKEKSKTGTQEESAGREDSCCKKKKHCQPEKSRTRSNKTHTKK